MNIHIYNCYHTPCKLLSDEVFRPIHVGRATSRFALDTAGDDTGDNISRRNSSFCELTAQYWAWKNDSSADWIGLVHYRRYLDFRGNTNAVDIWGHVQLESVTDKEQDLYGINARSVRELIENCGNIVAVMPRKWDVAKAGYKNIYDHYSKSEFHHSKDLDMLRNVVGEIYPEYLEDYDNFMISTEGYFTNIFVLRKDVFDDYSKWLFSILFELEKRINTINYSKGAKRVFGYLAERLINVYFRKNFSKNEDKIIHLDRLFVRNVQKEMLNVKPLHANSIPVVTASDEKFVPHLAAMLASIQDNLDNNTDLDFIVLDGGISQRNKNYLERQFQRDGSGRITFLDCTDLYTAISVHMHFSTPTYYRLSLTEILKGYKKIIYLDADLIVLADLRDLYDIPLENGFAVAAVSDVVMKHFVATGTPALYSTGGQKAEQYLREWVGMGNNYAGYFQAGVMLIDIDKFKDKNIYDKSLCELKKKKYWFVDQDVLNKLLNDSVQYLDMSWNVMNHLLMVTKGLDNDLVRKIKESIDSPRIIHYAGKKAKPWNNMNAPMSQYYWHYSRKTYWYDELMQAFRPQGSVRIKKYYNSMIDSVLYFMMITWRKMPNIIQQRLFWLRNAIVGEKS